MGLFEKTAIFRICLNHIKSLNYKFISTPFLLPFISLLYIYLRLGMVSIMRYR